MLKIHWRGLMQISPLFLKQTEKFITEIAVVKKRKRFFEILIFRLP